MVQLTDADSDSEDNIILSLIKDEVHKLEYLYKRDCRLHPQTNLSEGTPISVKQVVDKLKAEKQSLTTDLRIAHNPKFIREDKDNTTQIREILVSFDTYKLTFETNLKEMKGLSTYNYDVHKQITKLKFAAQKRRKVAGDMREKYVARRASSENLLHQIQCQVNQLICESRACRKNQLRILLVDRRGTHSHQLKRILSIRAMQNKGNKLVEEALTYYQTYELAKKEAERLTESNRENNLVFLMEMNDLDNVQMEKEYRWGLYETKMQDRIPKNLIENTREERNLERKIKEAEGQIQEYQVGLKSLEIFSPTLDIGLISRTYSDVEEMNFSRMKRICEIEEEAIKLRWKIVHLASEIDQAYKTKKDSKEAARSNILRIQAYSEHLTEQTEIKQTVLDITENTSTAILSVVMSTFRLLSGFSDSLEDFLESQPKVSKENIAFAFHFMEQRIQEYKYERDYLEVRAGFEVRGQGLKKEFQMAPGHPESYGGVRIPDIFVRPVEVSAGEEIGDIINAFGRIEPEKMEEARRSAREEMKKLKSSGETKKISFQGGKGPEDRGKSLLRRQFLKKTMDDRQQTEIQVDSAETHLEEEESEEVQETN